MGEKTSRYTASGPLRQTFKEFGKLNEKLVRSDVFGILEGPDLKLLHRSDVHRKIPWWITKPSCRKIITEFC